MKTLYITLTSIILTLFGMASFAIVSPALADCSNPPPNTNPLPNGYCITNGTDTKGNVTTPLANPATAYGLLGSVISVVFTIIIFAGVITCFIYLAIGCFQWITARGGAGAAQGRTTMIFAVLGLMLLAISYIFLFYFNDILPHK